LINGTSPSLADRLKARHPSEFVMSDIVRAELQYGARKSRRVRQNLAVLDDFLRPYSCVPFDARAADAYGVIRAALEATGQPIGANDLLIVATAVAHELVLVTHNVSEFDRVHGLQVEDWED